MLSDGIEPGAGGEAIARGDDRVTRDHAGGERARATRDCQEEAPWKQMAVVHPKALIVRPAEPLDPGARARGTGGPGPRPIDSRRG